MMIIPKAIAAIVALMLFSIAWSNKADEQVERVGVARVMFTVNLFAILLMVTR